MHAPWLLLGGGKTPQLLTTRDRPSQEEGERHSCPDVTDFTQLESRRMLQPSSVSKVWDASVAAHPAYLSKEWESAAPIRASPG